MRIWDTADGQAVYVFEKHNANILDACLVSPNTAASIDAEANVFIWNQETGNIQKQGRVLDTPIKLAEMLPVHGLVAAVDRDNRFAIWDWNRAKTLVNKSFPFAIRALAISSNRKWIAVAGENAKTSVWELDRLIQSASTPPNLELDGHADLVTSLCFSPDSQRLISTGDDEAVRIFELSLGKELLKLEGLRGLENLVGISPDGTQLMRITQRNHRVWNRNRLQNDAIESPTTLGQWHCEQARTALSQSNPFAAHFHCERAVQHDPDNPSSWETRALSNIHSGNWAAAERDVRRAIDIEATGRLQNMLARVLITQGKVAEYQQQCRVLAETIGVEDEPLVINSAAWICTVSPDSGADLDKWIELMDRIARSEKSAYYWNTLALLQYRAKHYPESIRSANESIKLGGAFSAPFDWIFKALCYVDQELLSSQATDSNNKKQSVAQRKGLQTQVASIVDWYSRQKMQIHVGMESSKLQNKETSIEFPMLIRELHTKIKAAGVAVDYAKLEGLLSSSPTPSTSVDPRSAP